MIKHLVLSGGGPIGLVQWGALKKLILKKIIKYENIETIYSTSIGCIIGVIFSLNFELSWIDDFIIKRPWHKIINFTSYDYLNVLQSKGLLDEDFFIKCLQPLLLAKDLSINITLKEFYEYTKIDIHFFTANLNNFCKQDINYKNNPNIKLITAINMSCGIPIIIKPVFYNNHFYLDGGLFINTPLNDCYIDNNCNKDEILCLVNYKNIDFNNKINKINNVNKIQQELEQDINLLNFLIFIIKSIFNKLLLFEKQNTLVIKNIINCSCTNNTIDIDYWIKVFYEKDERQLLINYGEELGEEFIKEFLLDLSANILDLSNNILDLSANILDLSNNILDSSANILDSSNNILDSSNNILDSSANILELI